MLSKIKNQIEIVKKTLWIFNKPKRFLVILYSSFIAVGMLDLVGISLIGPFILIFFEFNRLQQEFSFFSNFDQQGLALVGSISIISIFILRGVLVWILQSFILNITFNRQVEVRVGLLEHILKQDYSTRVTKSTADYLTSINVWCAAMASQVLQIFRLSIECITIFFIVCLLIFTDVQLFFIALIFTSLGAFLLVYFFSRRFIGYGADKNRGNVVLSNAIQESILGIKEVKIFGLSKYFADRAHHGASMVATAEKKLWLFSIMPRYIIEALLVALICILMLISVLSKADPVQAIATLSVFLVAALRLLPSINQIVSSSNAFNFHVDAINKLYSELQIISFEDSAKRVTSSQSEYISDPNDFQSLHIDNLSFSYNTQKHIFKDASLVVNKGDFIGIVGGSGEGKTTLIDLILGINLPTKGKILVNGKSIFDDIFAWRRRISYLPQESFLISGTIAENVALGVPLDAIDNQRVLECLERAGLKDFISKLENGIHTQTGERGLLFSGGQKQRVSIARAFYSERNIFLLDESTSALDKNAAERIISTVKELTQAGSTVLLISHNESSLNQCNRKVRIGGGSITELT